MKFYLHIASEIRISQAKFAYNFNIKVQFIYKTSDNATSLFFPPVINLKRIDCRELFQSALGTIEY